MLKSSLLEVVCALISLKEYSGRFYITFSRCIDCISIEILDLYILIYDHRSVNLHSTVITLVFPFYTFSWFLCARG